MTNLRMFLAVVLFATIGIPDAAHSAQGDVTVDFGGLCSQVVLTSGPPYELFPKGGSFDCSSGGTTYFRITDKVPGSTADADHAVIVPSSNYPTTNNTDGANDTLRFLNFNIYAVTATPTGMPQGYQISFWREHVSPETTDGPGGAKADRWYKSTASGTMKKTVNNWIKMDAGYVTHPVGGAETALGTAKTYTVTAANCAVSPCVIQGLSTSGKWPETSDSSTWLTSNRILRYKLSFRFQNGNANPNDTNSDWIKLHTGAKINDQTNADPGDQDECTDQYCNCKSGITVITITTRDAFNWMTVVTTSGDSKTQQSAKIEMFTKINWWSLQQDMAKGGGEYLASLATLWEIPIEEQPAFFDLAQENYHARVGQGITRRTEVLSELQESWTTRPVVYARSVER